MFPWREEQAMTAYRNEQMRQAENYQLIKEARCYSLGQPKALCQLLIRTGKALVDLGYHLESSVKPLPLEAK